ncbi:MAG: hypothetical protein AAFW69_04750 [Pseudomonadota bacterium]
MFDLDALARLDAVLDAPAAVHEAPVVAPRRDLASETPATGGCPHLARLKAEGRA